MRIVFELETLKPMIDAVEHITNGGTPTFLIETTLNRLEYQLEFDKYQGTISREQYISFLYGFLYDEGQEDWPVELRLKVPAYRHLAANLSLYREFLERLDDVTNATPMQEVNRILTNGLPDDFEMEELRIAINLGIGAGNGYVHNGMAELDFLYLVQHGALNQMPYGLAHEIHHLCFAHLTPTQPTLEELLYLYFAGEGLAAKYCHNAKGRFSRPLDPNRRDNLVDPKSWKRWTKRFDQGFAMLLELRDRIRSKDIDNVEHLHQAVVEAFFHKQAFRHNLLETMGNDIFGVIHDVLGKDSVYHGVRHPSMVPLQFNQAMKKLGQPGYQL
jgi:hypothetical protein